MLWTELWAVNFGLGYGHPGFSNWFAMAFFQFGQKGILMGCVGRITIRFWWSDALGRRSFPKW